MLRGPDLLRVVAETFEGFGVVTSAGLGLYGMGETD